MTDLDLDALEATARVQAAAYSKMLELDGGVGLLGVRHPDMFEDMMAWDGSSENEHADTTLALIARVREAEAKEREAWGVANTRLDAYTEVTREMHARELHHFEAERLLSEAEATIQSAYNAWHMEDRAKAIDILHEHLTRHQDKREGGSAER